MIIDLKKALSLQNMFFKIMSELMMIWESPYLNEIIFLPDHVCICLSLHLYPDTFQCSEVLGSLCQIHQLICNMWVGQLTFQHYFQSAASGSKNNQLDIAVMNDNNDNNKRWEEIFIVLLYFFIITWTWDSTTVEPCLYQIHQRSHLLSTWHEIFYWQSNEY